MQLLKQQRAAEQLKGPMRCQSRNSKDTNTVELKYTDLDGAMDKTKLNIFEDGSD